MYQITYRGHEFAIEAGQVFDPVVADHYLETVGQTDLEPAKTLTLADYEQMVAETAHYPGAGEHQLLYPLLGLVGEAGEVAEILGRLFQIKYTVLPGGPSDLDPAGVILGTMIRFGALMEVIKKIFRNDPPGELNAGRRETIARAIDRLERILPAMKSVMMHRDRVVFPPIVVEDESMLKELGDVGYYWFRMCTEAGLPAGRVALTNYAKLRDRAQRGVLRSTGDDR
jgi:NTP pyrophosphatase (non-canonical NTP hydrolase)